MTQTLDKVLLEKTTEAVKPIWQQVYDRSMEHLIQQLNGIREEVIRHGFRLHCAYPYPKSFGISRADYIAQLEIHKLAQSYYKCNESSYPSHREKDVTYTLRDDVDQIIGAKAKANADAATKAFTYKMVGKMVKLAEIYADHDESKKQKGWIGHRLTEVVSCAHTGHLFNGSVVTYKTNLGQHVWHTKTILNCSPLGTLFHQWPTTLHSSSGYDVPPRVTAKPYKPAKGAK